MQSSQLEQYAKELVKRNHVTRLGWTWLSPIAMTIHSLWRVTGLVPSRYTVPLNRRVPLDPQVWDKLKKKEALYLKLASAHVNPDGSIMTDKADAALYSFLIATRPQWYLAASEFFDKDGLLHRRPVSMPEPYPKESQSTTSRDMYVGFLFYCAMHGLFHLPSRAYGAIQDNFYVMGIGDPSRLIMMPGLESTTRALLYGKGIGSNMAYTWSRGLKGYQIKLDYLHIMAIGVINRYNRGENSIDKKMLKQIQHYKDTPMCPLIEIANIMYGDKGSIDKVVSMLLDESIWPNDRLPTSADRSVDWFWDAQNPKDKAPNPSLDIHEHNGCDFLFYMSLLRRFVVENDNYMEIV